MSSTEARQERRVHPIVSLDYRIRVVALVQGAAVIASMFYERGAPPLAWAVLAAWGLAWPHVAFVNARHGRNTKNAELTNLLIDAFACGAWIAVAHFSPWPTGVFLCAFALSFLSVAGIRFCLIALALLLAGAGLVGLYTGFAFDPSSSALTSTLSLLVLVSYATLFGVVTNRQARLIIQSRRTIVAQKAAIDGALQRQTAVGDVARVLTGSPTSAGPVLTTITEHVALLCDTADVTVFQVDGSELRRIATHGALPRKAISARVSLPLTRGTVSGRAVLDRMPVHMPDLEAETDPAFTESRAFQQGWGIRSMLAVPMLREGVPVGVILLRRTEVRPFDAREIELVQTFANQAAVALENARLFDQLGAKNRELTDVLERQNATSEILRVIVGSAADLQRVFDAILESAVRLCDGEQATAYRFDGERQHFVAHFNMPREVVENLRALFPRVPDRGAVTGLAILDRVVVHVPDIRADARFDLTASSVEPSRSIRTVVAVPMLRDGQPLGALFVSRGGDGPRPFSEAELALLQTFADQAVIAIEDARAYTELGTKNRELTDALERQRATGEILRVISRSPTDVQPVFDTIVRSAARLCDADTVEAYRFDGTLQHLVAHENVDAGTLAALRQRYPRPPHPQSVTGRAILDGETVHVSEAPADLRFPDTRAFMTRMERPARSMLVVPVRRDGESLGAIFVSRQGERPRPFSDGDIALLRTFADQAVIAIENVRLFNELETRTRELARSLDETRSLNEVTRAIGASVDLRRILGTVIHHAVSLSASDGGLVTEIDRRGNVFEGVATHGLSDEFVRYLRTTPVDWRTAVVPPGTQPGQPWEIPDIAEARWYAFREMLLREGFRAQLVAPIPGAERVIRGIVVFRRTPGRFEPRVVELLMALANQSKVAIENAALFQAIEDKSRQVKAADHAKSQFLANMSHELRTPLNAIIGYTELALDRTYGEVPEKLTDILERIEKSSRHLLGLINEVLDLSKIEAGQLTLSLDDYSLRDVIHSVCLSVEALAKEKGLALRVTVAPDLPLARGDERRLMQVLLNLVGNAIKFTETGHVAIEASHDGDALVVAVSDTGPGISAADHARIFEEFQQADASDTRKKGGTGLGLAIARHIVALHGGRLWVESAPGRGSTFRLTVPVRVEQQAEAP